MASLGRLLGSSTRLIFNKFVPSTTSKLLAAPSVSCQPCSVSWASSLLPSSGLAAAPSLLHQQLRGRYVNWMMLRDVRRRDTVKEYAPLRLRVNSLRKNTILPKEIQELADIHIQSLPRNSARNRLTNRCIVTSRARGKLRRWRISRLVWRHLADYNKLSGVKRAHW